MTGFIHYFTNFFTAGALLRFFNALPHLISSRYLNFWFLMVFPLLRFGMPDVIVWLITMFRPSFAYPPVARTIALANPLISVVIAGRNEGSTIGGTINSILRCGYSNLEIIFVDDASDDDTLAVATRVAGSVGAGDTGPHEWGQHASGQRDSGQRDSGQHDGGRHSRKVAIFSSPRRSGKPSALNMGLSQAKGDFIAVVDADCEVQFGAMQCWLEAFADPRVGAAAANIRVGNADATLVTALQECEYATVVTLVRLVAAKLNLLAIVTGAGGMFRAEALRALGGYDTGLGDDTDMALRLRKSGWRLGFAMDALVWATVPETWRHLTKQRTRWARNMVKIRLSKHRDMLNPVPRYGFFNAVVAVNLIVIRLVLPFAGLLGIVWLCATDPLSRPALVTNFYLVSVLYATMKMSIARDLTAAPQLRRFLLIPILPLYFLYIKIVEVVAITREMLRISRHDYVPPHVWRQIPHW